MQSITLIGIVFGMMTLITLGLIAVIRQQRQLSASQKDIATTLAELKITSQVQRSLQDTQQEKIQLFLDAQQNHFQKLQKQQHTDLQDGMSFLSKQLHSTLSQSADSVSKRYDQLNQMLREQLKDISSSVNQHLMKGFEKTTNTFNDVIKRLSVIDAAQQKITELSAHVVDLQTVLVDHRSRGAYGESQLSALLHNMLPENHFSLQHTLSNGKRVDCLIYLPAPTGNISVDAKFPLESFRALQQCDNEQAFKKITTQFKQDIKVHITAISSKYIIPGETADGAVMFLPTEGVFAEIHANHADLIDFAQQHRVWIVSPTTMMAVLTTMRAVIKDEATRQQVHIIQDHLIALGKDFVRFQKRMDQLSRHIQQANNDVELVHKSSQKITRRFEKIEQADISSITSITTGDEHATCEESD